MFYFTLHKSSLCFVAQVDHQLSHWQRLASKKIMMRLSLEVMLNSVVMDQEGYTKLFPILIAIVSWLFFSMCCHKAGLTISVYCTEQELGVTAALLAPTDNKMMNRISSSIIRELSSNMLIPYTRLKLMECVGQGMKL